MTHDDSVSFEVRGGDKIRFVLDRDFSEDSGEFSHFLFDGSFRADDFVDLSKQVWDGDLFFFDTECAANRVFEVFPCSVAAAEEEVAKVGVNVLRHHGSVLLEIFSNRFCLFHGNFRVGVDTAADVIVYAVIDGDDDFACARAFTNNVTFWAGNGFIISACTYAFFELQRGCRSCRVDDQHFRCRQLRFKKFRIQTTRFKQRFYVRRGFWEATSDFSFFIRVFRPKYAAFFDDNLFFFSVLREERWEPRVEIGFGEI